MWSIFLLDIIIWNILFTIFSTKVIQMKVKKIETKHCGLLSSCMRLQRDNTQTHTACHTMKQIQDLTLEVLPHPLYSPDLASSYCHPFQPPKTPSTWTSLHVGWGGKRGSAWLVGTATTRLLLPRNLCLVERCRRCVERGEDCTGSV